MSRANALARVLRDLREDHDHLLEKKSTYDHDTNRAILALGKFHSALVSSSAPDIRKGQSSGAAGANRSQGQKETAHSEENSAENESEETAAQHPGWAKKAYRAIVLRTHPDRVDNDPDISDAQRDRLILLYQQAVKAWSEGDYQALAEIAAELDIETGMPSDELERALESKIASLREESQRLQKSVSWTWGTSFGNMPLRVQVLRRCCQLMSIPTPEESVLLEIIRELESQAEFDITDRLGRVRRMRAGADRRRIGQRPERRIR